MPSEASHGGHHHDMADTIATMRSLRRLVNVAEPEVHHPVTPIRYDNGGGIVCTRHNMKRRSGNLGRRFSCGCIGAANWRCPWPSLDKKYWLHFEEVVQESRSALQRSGKERISVTWPEAGRTEPIMEVRYVIARHADIVLDRRHRSGCRRSACDRWLRIGVVWRGAGSAITEPGPSSVEHETPVLSVGRRLFHAGRCIGRMSGAGG